MAIDGQWGCPCRCGGWRVDPRRAAIGVILNRRVLGDKIDELEPQGEVQVFEGIRPSKELLKGGGEGTASGDDEGRDDEGAQGWIIDAIGRKVVGCEQVLSVDMGCCFEGEKDGKGACIQGSVDEDRGNDGVELEQLTVRHVEFFEPQGEKGEVVRWGVLG